MTDTPKKIAQLSPEQRDLLLRRAREGHGAGRTGIQPRKDRDAPAPLSFAQQRLWFIDQLQPGTSAYNVPIAVRITGPLDAGILRETLDRLVRRHETLRTTIRMVDGQVAQVIDPAPRATLEQVDLSQLPAGQAERTALELCIDESRLPFELGKGPLLRMTLLRLPGESSILLLIFHHIISDLWSLGVFIRELTTIYSALQSGRAATLPELRIQYADYAAWQREELQGERLEREVEHWRRELAGAPTSLELPADHLRPPVMHYRGTRLPAKQPAARLNALKELAQKEGVTLFMALLAAYSVLLARLSRQEDLTIGSPVANRSRVELEGLIGFFINMVVLRMDLSGDPSFRELLGRVKERCVQALNHQELPFEHLVNDLKLERDLSRPPLIQAALALQNVSLPPLAIAGLRFEVMDIQIGIAKFDLSLELFEKNQGLEGWLEYNTELFEESTAERIARCLSVLLESLSGSLELPVWELPLLEESERLQVLDRGREKGAEAPRSLLARVAEAVRRRPDAPAALGPGGEVLSYGELAARAERIAAGLRSLGAGPEVLVGIVMERSPELLTGILGTLKAGGACLLLDPRRERSWLERMLERSGCAVVLTRGSLAGRLPEHGAVEALLERLEQGGETAGTGGGKETDPESLAFVVQTSGPHRQPRLVGLPHRSVAAWMEAWAERLDPGDLGAVSGDSALETIDGVFDLMVPLCLGGCVAADSPASLASATPSQIAAGLREGGMKGVQVVRSFGEALGEPLKARLLASGVERVHDSFSSAVAGVWPREDLRAYVLGRLGMPVPVGVFGDLWLGGEGLARGYEGSADRTAERFVPDPFGGRPGARLVRTEDLARWRADGRLEIAGPLEREVRVRGLRLELGTVEELLAGHPGVLQAVAGLQEEGQAERLVAHVLGAGPELPKPEELREFLRSRLPEPQVPWGIAAVDEIPRTPTGRADPKRLPRVEPEEAAQTAPRTEVERMLVEIWRELLDVEGVGIHDNFFQLGGNSLIATQVVARINEVFQLSLGVETLFRNPTIADLALTTDEHLLAQLGDEDIASLLGESQETWPA
jgi:non-ribosomal peptide synthetase component F